MNAAPSQNPFPVGKLPSVLSDAVRVTHNRTQAPLSMIATLAIGVASEAAQGVAGVQIPHGPYCLLSNWVLVIANSGEGKTPVLNMLREPITTFEATRYQEYKVKMDQYEIDHHAWKLEQDEYSMAVRKATRKGLDSKAAKEQLAEHMKAKPRKPRNIKQTYSDATPEAFCNGLFENWPNATLVSDEASIFFNGQIANGFAMLNQRWEAQPLSIERRSHDTPIYVQDPRVMLIWAIQPGPLKKYFARRGDEARELGTLPRFLVCHPDSNQGHRNVNSAIIDPLGLTGFHERVTALLQASVGEDGEPLVNKRLLTFSPQAEARYHDIRASIEEMLVFGGPLADVKDYAAKLPRHLARLAGLFELFETGKEVISLDMLERACTVLEWYTNEYIRLVTPPSEIPQDQKDADLLYPWLQQYAKQQNHRYIMRNSVRKYGPSSIRNKQLLEAALLVLQGRGLIGLQQLGPIHYIDMSPLLQYDPTSLHIALALHRVKRTKRLLPDPY